jgi:hypothetical protein
LIPVAFGKQLANQKVKENSGRSASSERNKKIRGDLRPLKEIKRN